ncbi:MAG: hypothetical protein MUD01_03000 [Chloroflexaceae bacterium]|jgi:hypothetical protein|nr:hypothetical protein [Chloroflexaceae bacterium]
MLRFVYFAVSLWLLARRVLLLHLAIVNEGSPTPESAHQIDDISLSQAFYGRLAAGERAFFRFRAAEDAPFQLSMLVPQRFHSAGFQPTITLRGPGLPVDGLTLASGDEGQRLGTTAYQRTHRLSRTLAAGDYQLVVSSPVSGVYCMCCGTREPDTYADAATRARVQALLES